MSIERVGPPALPTLATAVTPDTAGAADVERPEAFPRLHPPVHTLPALVLGLIAMPCVMAQLPSRPTLGLVLGLATFTLVVVVATLAPVLLLGLRRSMPIADVAAGRATIRGTIMGEHGACVLRVTPDLQKGVTFRVADGTGSVEVDATGIALLPLWTELRSGDEVLLTGPCQRVREDGSYRGAHRVRFDGTALDPVIAVRVRRVR